MTAHYCPSNPCPLCHPQLAIPQPALAAPSLYAVSEGTMELMGHTIRTYVLNDGRRMVNAEDAEKLLREIGMIQ